MAGTSAHSVARPAREQGKLRKRRKPLAFQATWIIPALALVTLGLGVSGWLDRGLPLGESLYRAVALFDIGNGFYGEGGDSYPGWRFNLGRWTGLAALFGAAFFALGVVLQEQLAIMTARWFRQSVVVVGSHGVSAKAFEVAQQENKTVVWLGAPRLEVSSVRSIALPWPAGDLTTSVLTYAGDAEHVLVAHDDDAASLALARAARVAAPQAFITVLMRNAFLAEHAAATVNESRTRILSAAAVSARHLHLHHPPFLIARTAGHQRIHALIVGFGQVGQAIARDLIVNCRTSFLGLPQITIVDPRADALGAVLRVRAPEIDACAHFTFINGQIGVGAMEPDPDTLALALGRGGPLSLAYVCVGADEAALTSAAMLQSLVRNAGIGETPIFVRLRDAGALFGTAAEGLDALKAFGDVDILLGASDFLSQEPDAAARSFSAAYRAALPTGQRDDPANRSARAWDDLDETFRQANRDAVAHIPAKMASAGIDPALWLGVRGLPRLDPATPLFATDEECEVIARLEHERWSAQRRMDGWRQGSEPDKDIVRRTHPSLAPYDSLSEDIKEYDRVYVRETQAACLVQAEGVKPVSKNDVLG